MGGGSYSPPMRLPVRRVVPRYEHIAAFQMGPHAVLPWFYRPYASTDAKRASTLTLTLTLMVDGTHLLQLVALLTK